MPDVPNPLTPSKDQISGSADRILIAAATWLLTWLATKGYISQSDVISLVPVIVMIAGAGWGLWVNRQKSLVQSVAAIPGTTVVTSDALAKATPDEQNIVSNADVKVTNK